LGTITDLVVEIYPRENIVDNKKHSFCEVSYTYKEDGLDKCALTRLFHPLDDSPFARAAQAQDFLKRQARPWGD
jgi:hypothetical protein